MSRHNFSLGPWAIDGSANSDDLDIVNYEGRIAMIDGSRETGWNTPTINANARLIAAAPDMLLCLRNVIDSHGEVDQDLWNRIREVIANATGEAS